jgi:hypothetical protein
VAQCGGCCAEFIRGAAEAAVGRYCHKGGEIVEEGRVIGGDFASTYVDFSV